MAAWIFLEVFSEAQHICLCKEETAVQWNLDLTNLYLTKSSI